MKKVMYIIFVCVETILLFLIIGALTTAITNNIYADILIQSFKDKCEYLEKESTSTTRFYKGKAEEGEEIPFQIKNNKIYPGATGDILISLNSEVTIPVIGSIVSYFAGGHAALVLGDYQDLVSVDNGYGIQKVDEYNTLEASGINDGAHRTNVLRKDYWTTGHPYKETICLRVKMTEEQKHEVMANAMAHWGDAYNYTFLFETKEKSYCSDVISKVFSKIGVNLNKDGFVTSIYDLVVSNETYIVYYQYFDDAGVKNIYYLG